MLRWDLFSLATTYTLLRGTMPFKRWKLPPSDEIRFRTSKVDHTYGTFVATDRTITISGKRHHRLESMIVTMAHEMVHLYMWKQGYKNWTGHGAEFKRLAHLVCKHHGFEESDF